MSFTENMPGSDNTASKTVDFSLAHTIYVDQYENLNKLIEEADTVFSQAVVSVEVLNCCARDLQKALDLYDDSWVTYQEFISSESGLLNAKMHEHRALCRNVRKARKAVLDRISSLTISTPQPIPHNPLLPMPKLSTVKIPTFEGVYQEWPAFWDLYSSLVHNRTDISDVIKFSILRGNLTGNALKVVEGLSVTNQNYNVAVRMLTETYANSSRLSRSLLKELGNLSPPKHNYEELLNFRLSYQKLLLQIQNSGINVNQSDPVIASNLIEKLPSETSQLLIQKYNSFDLTLNQISEGLKYVLELFDFCKDKDQRDKVSPADNKSHSTKVATVSSRTENVKSKGKGKSAPTNSQQQKSANTSPKGSAVHKPCTF